MQALVFNTTKKNVELFEDLRDSSRVIHNFDNIPTVRVLEGYYEVIQEEGTLKFPVLRVPISNTNMIIEK